ncbi:hypothetical protein PGW94_04335 [Candidatus Anaplasma sp. TIGMIC]|nr:hypothetical protein [Candidatus Anaplasma sp. TIGMIC]MDB1135796.1 hypothetical protein [Candidatus Anaplasma sp. TIGMIC]
MSREGGGEASVFHDPEYRKRYREKFLEAQKNGMDMVVYPDGTIALIESKMVMHTYGWHKRRRGFERTRSFAQSPIKRGGLSTDKQHGDVQTNIAAEETEYA